MHITLQPGESLKPHKTPVDVTFSVLEGTPTVHVRDESLVFEKGTLVKSPKDNVFVFNQFEYKNRNKIIARNVKLLSCAIAKLHSCYFASV